MGAVVLLRSWPATPPLNERDTVLLTDFTNTTGEAVFDDTLKQALAPIRHSQARAQEIEASNAPTDTFLHSIFLPEIRATIALARKEAGRAIDLLEAARPYELGDFTSSVLLLRGRAYLETKAASRAEAELQKVLDHRPLFGVSPIYPLALLELARAKARAGDVAGSRRAYQDLLAVWKDADPGLPVVEQAKSEYARLGS